METADSFINTREVAEEIQEKTGKLYKISWTKDLMKAAGYRHKRERFNEAYMDSPKNLKNRSEYAKTMITLLEQGKKFVSIDECGFNCSIDSKKSWLKKGPQRRKSILRRFANLTMLNAVTEEGDFYYCFIVGSHNQQTYARFLRLLTLALQKKDKDFRSKYILLQDNLSAHQTTSIQKVIR